MDTLLSDAYVKEIENTLFYAYLATEFSKKSLMGFAKFFKNQSKEEYIHSQKVLNHLIEHKITISLNINYSDFIYKEDLNFVEEALRKSLEREKSGSSYYKELMKYAEENKHYKHQDFVLWFVKEQIEEENFFSKLIVKFENSNVYLLDKELGEES